MEISVTQQRRLQGMALAITGTDKPCYPWTYAAIKSYYMDQLGLTEEEVPEKFNLKVAHAYLYRLEQFLADLQIHQFMQFIRGTPEEDVRKRVAFALSDLTFSFIVEQTQEGRLDKAESLRHDVPIPRRLTYEEKQQEKPADMFGGSNVLC
jgi:hypothetical protein